MKIKTPRTSDPGRVNSTRVWVEIEMDLEAVVPNELADSVAAELYETTIARLRLAVEQYDSLRSVEPMPGRHAGDCTIFQSRENERPTDCICTCGYGLRLSRSGDYSELYRKMN